MKKFLWAAVWVAAVWGGDPLAMQAETVEPVASFQGMQVTGIAVADDGRMFVNFPRWREGVPYSVMEIGRDGARKPYPDPATNAWEIGDEVVPDRFICVQSVVAHVDRLYVLDTKNPLMKGIVAPPTIYVYELNTDALVRTYPLTEAVHLNSYVNDLRVDDKNGKIYLTDSGAPGLIVLDLVSGGNYRLLDHHPFTTAEVDQLTIGGVKYAGRVHADGIALDREHDILYFHPLSGYTLYGIPTGQLIERRIDEKNIFKLKTPAPDGMIMAENGDLIMGDLEKNAIVYLTPDRKELRTLAADGGICWPDTFAIYDGFLYFTNSRIHEAQGDISRMVFSVDRVALPDNQKIFEKEGAL